MFGEKKLSAAIFRRKKGRFELLDSCNPVSASVESDEAVAADAIVLADSGEPEPAKAKQLQAVRHPEPALVGGAAPDHISPMSRRRG